MQADFADGREALITENAAVSDEPVGGQRNATWVLQARAIEHERSADPRAPQQNFAADHHACANHVVAHRQAVGAQGGVAA